MLNGQTYLFLLPFMILLSAFLSINCDYQTANEDGTKRIQQTAAEGESVILQCRTSKLNGNKYRWTHNGIPISNSNRIHQIGQNLHVNKLQRNSDNGIYNCIIENDKNEFNHQISTSIELEAIWLDAARILYRPLSKREKNNIFLFCHVDGNNLDEIKWYRNDTLLTSSAHISVSFHKMVLKRPTSNDNGNYYCEARNGKGTVRSEIYRLEIDNDNDNDGIKVNGLRCAHSNVKDLTQLADKSQRDSSKWAKHHGKGVLLCRSKRSGGDQKTNNAPAELLRQANRKHLTVNEKQFAVLTCDLKNAEKKSMKMTIKWKKDGKLFRQADINAPRTEPLELNPMENPLMREDGPGRVSVNSKNGSLIITSTIPSDSGTYQCDVLKNSDAPISQQITEFNIIEELKFTPQPTSKHLEIGSIGKVHCKVQGTPTPQVQWAREGFDKLPETVEDINGTLIFRNVSESDKGNYTCNANSAQGTISATVVINAVVAPKFIVKPHGTIEVNEMGATMIHCTAIGDPKPTIQWDKDLSYLNINNSDTSRMHVLENGTLQFTEVHLEDEGIYGCTIGNSAGLKREDVRLIVKPTEDFISEDSEDNFVITRAVLITITVVFAYIILVVGLMLWCKIKRQARKNQMQLIVKDAENGDNGDNAENDDPRPNDEHEPCLPEKTNNKLRNGNGVLGENKLNNVHKDGAQKSDDTAASNNSKTSKKSQFDQITIPRTILFDVTQIGRGEFGNVFVAKLKSNDLKQYLHKDTVANMINTVNGDKQKSKSSLDDINEIKEDNEDSDETKYALMKALNRVKDENICVEFRRQIEMFRTVSHQNVVKLFGLCREKDPHYLVLEHSDVGDLKQFILSKSNDLTHQNGIINKVNQSSLSIKNSSLQLEQLLSIVQHITRGMDAIYRSRYIHKDLAARNCIISSDFIVKVSYPSLLKDKYSKEYYKHKNVIIPLRWMAPEYLEDDDHTIKSDVYSFGVTIWEIFTLCAQLPLENLTNEEFLQQLQTGKLERCVPNDLPEEMKAIVTSCWKQNPKERPSFSQLHSTISKCLQSEKTK